MRVNIELKTTLRAIKNTSEITRSSLRVVAMVQKKENKIFLNMKYLQILGMSILWLI